MTEDQTPAVQPDPLAPAKEVKKEVKAALEAAKVELGKATLPGGAVVPAIYVGDWPTGTVVKGLECLIPKTPRLKAPAGFAFLGFERVWPIRFINNAADPDMLEQAAQALAQRFWPFSTDPQLLEESPETCEQMVIGLNVDQQQL